MSERGHSLRQLAARVLRPSMTRHDKLRVYFESVGRGGMEMSAGVLWRTLAEQALIPARWLDDRARTFDDGRSVGRTSLPDLVTALSLAADPDGVEAVEVLLRSAWPWLAPDASRPPSFCWRVVPRERVQPGGSRPGHAFLVDHAIRRGSAGRWTRVTKVLRSLLGERRDARAEMRSSIPGLAESQVYNACAYEEVLGYDVTAEVAEAFARDLGSLAWWNEHFSDHPSPFGAIRRIWELGYAIDEIHDDRVVLLCPEAPVSEAPPWTRTVHVAGFSFDDRSRHLPTLAASQPVRLVRQPENPTDTNAIIVTTASGDELGYVPRSTAAALAPHLDEGLAHSAEIAHVVPDAPSLDRAVYITVRALV